MIQPSTVKEASATKLARVEAKSRQNPDLVFSNLGHILSLDLLRDCYRSIDGSKAVGIDGVTKKKYGEKLEENLGELLLGLRCSTYIPKVARLVEIPKADGSTRPLAVACIEDKIVQDAVRRIVERIFEPLFQDFSYGFRPDRNCHKAIVALDSNLMSRNTGAVLEVDIRKCFPSIPHEMLLLSLQNKISDSRFMHLVSKLIKAEVVDEDGNPKRPLAGTPQGSILSPLLANIFLDEAIDKWFLEINTSQFGGLCTIVRYADDLVFTAPSAEVANELRMALSNRLQSYGLELHEGKTQVLLSGRQEAAHHAANGISMPTFTFLGFLHVWGQSTNRRTGKKFWRVMRRTCPIRFRAKLLGITECLHKRRHEKDLLERMKAIVQGYLNYFAINDNSKRIKQFVHEVRKLMFKWVNRRSQKRSFTWGQFEILLERIKFPEPRILHDLFFASSAYRRNP